MQYLVSVNMKGSQASIRVVEHDTIQIYKLYSLEFFRSLLLLHFT